MIQLEATPQSIVLNVPSDVTFVDYAVELLRTLLRYYGHRNPTPLLVVARELLKNAVVHGNQNDMRVPVHLRVEAADSARCRVVVEDSGRGFDTRGVTGRSVRALATGSAQHGYEIIQAFAGELEFSERGNRVTAVVELPP